MKKIFIVYILSINALTACSDSNQELSSQHFPSKKIECDSLLLSALEVIGKESGRGEKENWFSYNYRINDSIQKRVKIPFLDTYHDSLDVASIWITEGLDTIFTIDEIENYKKNVFQISTDCLTDYRFITQDTLNDWQELYDKNQMTEMFVYASFSKPLVSKDGKYLLIEYQETCRADCGGATTFILEFSNGLWHKSREIIRWVG